MFVCNEAFYYQLGDILDQYLAQYHTDGTHLYSMKANGYVEVGAKGYDTYRWMGNEVTFTVDRTLSREYGHKGYALALDLTSNRAGNQPPIGLFTLKNGDMMQSYIKGVGGLTGLESGEVSTPVAGAKRVIWGLV